MTVLIPGLVLLLLVAALAQLKRSCARRRLLRGSQVASTARGPVEYALVGGGPVVLVLHGGAGGWDQGLALGVSLLSATEECVSFARAGRDAEVLLGQRYAVLAPSRVGYLRTPLSTGRTPAEGADAMAALLDTLGLQRVLVVGISGGGPTALQFALRHARRCAALVMVAAIARRHLQPARTTENVVAGIVVFARGAGWFVDLLAALVLALLAVRPRWAARQLLQVTEALDDAGIKARLASIAAHPDQLTWIRGLLASTYPLSLRRTGLKNDLAQFAALEDYPVQHIACPTLVVHGQHDGNVPVDHAEFVAQRVPGARLVLAKTCGHLLWASEEQRHLRAAVDDFLAAQASSADCWAAMGTSRTPS